MMTVRDRGEGHGMDAVDRGEKGRDGTEEAVPGKELTLRGTGQGADRVHGEGQGRIKGDGLSREMRRTEGRGPGRAGPRADTGKPGEVGPMTKQMNCKDGRKWSHTKDRQKGAVVVEEGQQ